MISPLTHIALPFTHGFFTRKGGVSEGIYHSLNIGLGSDDEPAHVQQNRARIKAYLGASHLITPYQTHSTDVLYVSEPPSIPLSADALVTTQAGFAIGVLSADCVPVLFAAPQQNIIAAAHAGWKGAQAGIISATIEKMRALGGRDIIAVIGPCISQSAYEVGAEFPALFPDDLDLFSEGKPNHFQFDLRKFVERQCLHHHVRPHHIQACTYTDQDRFFSHRHCRHHGEADYGRQGSFIMLK